MQLSLLFDMPIILYRSLLILIFGLIVLAEEQTSVVNVENQDDEKIMLFVTSKSAGDDVTTERANIDERQARMSLHTESPRAKVRREQAFRNTLVARRRKIQRNNNKRVSSSEVPTASATSSLRRSSLRRRPVQRETIMGDLLEMQESQNGLYVTVPEQHATNDTHEIVIETLGGGSSGSSTTTSTKRNSTTTTKPYRGSSSSTTLEHRGKKIVAMPASLYNHFRPVESNIPIEDMSQFLYFGQKLRGTGMGKDISSASPSPKKLLAGFEDILDDEMNSVDRTSSSVSKSTKMRTTSFREQTTRPACPDKEQAEARGNSINSTNIEKNSNNSNLSLRIVVTESTTLVPINTTINTRNATIMGEMVNTTSTTTIQSNMVNLNLTEDTPKATIMSRGKHHHYHQQHVTEEQSKEHQQKQQQQQQQEQKQKHQEQRATLRNSETQTSTTGAGIQGPITSSSQATAIVVRELSTGATVELSTTIAAAAALAPHAQPSVRQEQRIQQPGFTIRWTDTRPSNTVAAINKRRRLAAASRRRDKSARNMDNFNNSTTTTTTAPTTTSTATSTTGSSDAVPVEFPVTPKIILQEITSSTTMNPIINSVNPNVITSTTTLTSSTTELPETTTLDRDIITTTIGKMLDPSEVQKMYRAGSTSQPELSTTTITTTGSPIPSTEIIDDVPSTTIINTSTTISASTTASTTTSTTVRSTGERSPEVRARNLADKAKDDVLPIMQLYNTSTMFNASESPLTTTTTSTTSTVLPTELIIDTTTPTATTTIVEPVIDSSSTTTTTSTMTTEKSTTTKSTPTTTMRPKKEYNTTIKSTPMNNNGYKNSNNSYNKTKSDKPNRREFPGDYNGAGYYPLELNNNNINNNNNISSKNRTFFEPAGFVTMGAAAREPYANISEVISRRHDGDALASQETVAVVSYILATLVVFPIAVGVALILRRLILRNRKVLEESDTSSEISCRKDALNLENGDFKMSIEKTITKLPRIQHLCHEAEKPPPPTSQESRWEFPRDKLRLQTVLGEGNFGQVWKAEADDLTGHQGTTRLVAVKTVKEGASDREKEDLVRELEIMQRVGSHPNVVTLLGCCTEQEPHYLILEYVMYGKLLAYLRDHRTRQDFYNFSEDSAALTSRDLTVFGYCVARGMEYLASKKIIHRDLAARNVLVDHNKLCKIADFGMSRFANEDGEVIETRHGRNALPIRWMAPESLIYSLFTTKTDVWSFGILMWEIVTLGSTPYPDMTAREVMRSVQSGYRLERPSHCRSELFRIIARCWQADPDRRPEFQVLRRDLAQLLEDNMNGHYVDLESFASECTD